MTDVVDSTPISRDNTDLNILTQHRDACHKRLQHDIQQYLKSGMLPFYLPKYTRNAKATQSQLALQPTVMPYQGHQPSWTSLWNPHPFATNDSPESVEECPLEEDKELLEDITNLKGT